MFSRWNTTIAQLGSARLGSSPDFEGSSQPWFQASPRPSPVLFQFQQPGTFGTPSGQGGIFLAGRDGMGYAVADIGLTAGNVCLATRTFTLGRWELFMAPQPCSLRLGVSVRLAPSTGVKFRLWASGYFQWIFALPLLFSHKIILKSLLWFSDYNVYILVKWYQTNELVLLF